MKKYDDGYALSFVLVVMVIICLVGVSILSASLSNLQSQQAFIERMQDQYEAEGQIEKVMAVLQQKYKNINSEIIIDACNTSGVSIIEGIEFTPTVDDDTSENDDDTIEFQLKVREGTVEITSTIQIVGIIKPNYLDGNSIPDSYDVSEAKYTYSSYEINTVSEGGEADES